VRQVTDQAEQGTKVAGFYRLAELPAILIIDPFTGAKLRHWTGFVEAHRCALASRPSSCGSRYQQLRAKCGGHAQRHACCTHMQTSALLVWPDVGGSSAVLVGQSHWCSPQPASRALMC